MTLQAPHCSLSKTGDGDDARTVGDFIGGGLARDRRRHSACLSHVEGRPAAAAIELTLLDGSKVNTADLRGQVVVLNFWATWCVPCRTELPLLDAYYRKLQGKGLRVYAITTEGSLPLSKLKPLFAAMAIPSVRKVRGISTDMSAVPTNYVVDRAGIIRNTKAGAFDLQTLNATLIPLLNERPPA